MKKYINSDIEINIEKKPISNVIKNNTILDNPFIEEFDEKDIVNRLNISDFIFEDIQKVAEEKIEEEKLNKKEPFYISKKELDYLIAENPRLNILKKDEDGNLKQIEQNDSDMVVSLLTSELKGISGDELIEINIPVGKKNVDYNKNVSTENKLEDDYKDDGYYHHHSEYDDEEDAYYMSSEERDELEKKEKMHKTMKVIQNVISDLAGQEQYINPDEKFRDFLQENFKDYLLVKKISGKSDTKHSQKILPKEKINENNEKIEVSDFYSERSTHQHKTSLIINRNEDSEIESIEVYCKCGEKTIIKFQEKDIASSTDANEGAEVKSNTVIVVDTIDTAPIYDDTKKQ
ncbi:MAG: hypothetical protein FWG85_03795 [Bacteroidetes bacterium]|nr:hypothetical protein [Bacteroidota bacterium]